MAYKLKYTGKNVEMKKSTPKSRFDLKIPKQYRVLEVGGGHNPHPRSNFVVDKFVDSNYHRQSDIKVLGHQEFIQADGASLPFPEKSFDYVICNQVLEHVDHPDTFLAEQMRVARAGYLETPSLIGEYLFPKESHRWLILELDNKLVLMDKEKYWSQKQLDLGYLFLTYLQKTSLAYRILSETRPDLHTVRYEWEGTIDFEVNSVNPDYIRYFEAYWDQQMVETHFPETGRLRELMAVSKSMLGIIWSQIIKPIKVSGK